MLKELNKLWVEARRQRAAWRRWFRKLPHNRVRRRPIRNLRGWVYAYDDAEPIPEPVLNPAFLRKVQLPSGRVEIVLADGWIEAAYRLARYPKPGADDVAPLPVAEEEICRRYAEYCGS
jgi:hypothetical protein